jgi:hypothetical protein
MQGYMYKTLKSIFIAGLLVSLSTQLPLAAMQQEIQQQKKVEKKQQNNSGSIFTLENLLRAGAITGVVIGVAAIWYFSSNNGNGSDTSNNKNNVRISNIKSSGKINITNGKVIVNDKDYSSLVQNNKNCDISITNIGGDETVTINGKDYSPLPQKFSSKETLNEEGAGLSKIVVQNTRGKVMVKRDTTLKDVVIDIEKKATKEEDLKSLIVATKKEFSTTEKKDGTLSIISTWDTNVIQNACINYSIKVPGNVHNSKVTTNGGEIAVSNLPGNHDLKTPSGDIEVCNSGDITCDAGFGNTNIKDAKKVTVVSKSGGIYLESVGDVEFESSFGKTEIKKAGDIKGSSKSGDAIFNNVGAVEFDSGFGKTIIKDAKKVTVVSKSGDIDLESVGDVNSESFFGKTKIKKAGDIKGSSKSGDAVFNNVGDVTFASGFGNTNIKDAKKVTVASKSGDIDLENVTGKGLASTKFGNVTIKNSPNTTGTTKSGRIIKE